VKAGRAGADTDGMQPEQQYQQQPPAPWGYVPPRPPAQSSALLVVILIALIANLALTGYVVLFIYRMLHPFG
jgi:hypothetical protein